MQSPFNYVGNDTGSSFNFADIAKFNSPTAGLVPSAMTAGASPLGFNMDTMRLGLGGLQTIGNLWNSFQANQLAKEQFDFTKGITNTNLSNSIQSYNTAMTDKIGARAFTEGRPDGYVESYLAENKLQKREY